MKLLLEIETGNDAMQTMGDIARALTEVARRMYDARLATATPDHDVSGKIFDDNGNRVGKWYMSENGSI